MPKNDKKKVTRTMKVTMSEEEFRKFDQGITHSSGGIRTEDGKLSVLPDIAPLDSEEEPLNEETWDEWELELRRDEYLEQEERLRRKNERLETLSNIAESFEILAEFLAENPEVVEGLINLGYKVHDFAVSSFSKLSFRMKRLTARIMHKPVPDRSTEAACEVEIIDEQQERIPISEEQADLLLTNMRDTAKKLATMMYLWSMISIKDSKSDAEYIIEQGFVKELLSDDMHQTIETLVANRHLLDENTAQTLSDFLDGYLTYEDRRIPIPVLAERNRHLIQEKEN